MLPPQFSKTHNLVHLRTFLDTLPRGGIAAFAAKVHISPIYLSQLAAGQGGREPSPELCVLIEQESLGQVRRWDTRPTDWHRIWPELIAIDGAPSFAAAVYDEPAAAMVPFTSLPTAVQHRALAGDG
jgi:DNA-binding transcriptional regulator YdaS (Cro superfamily)